MNPTVYQPLSREKRELRLARIKPAPYDDHPNHLIEVTLKHAPLSNPPTFAALSYTWGDEQDKTIILLNAIPTLVRRNLYVALLRLQKRASDNWIWIDAICINQTDDIERSWQVNEMRSIFSLADRVYCWLDPAADDSDAALQILKRVAQEVEDAGMTMDDLEPFREAEGAIDEMRLALCTKLIDYDELNPKDGSCSQGAVIMESLLHRPYFSRVWTIQEFSLAKKCELLCGQSSLNSYTFDIAMKAIRLVNHYKSRLWPGTSFWGSKFFFPFNWAYLASKQLKVREAIVSGSPPGLYNIMRITTACPGRPLYAASDPRDIVFGVLGCAADAESLGLRADYRKPANQVFAEATKALIRQRKGYQLGYCNWLKDMKELPSWVPDWRRLGELGIKVYPVSYLCHFVADGGLLVDPPDDSDLGDWKILRSCGWYVDIVTSVMKSAERRVFDPYSPPYLVNCTQWLLEIVDFFQLDSLGRSDEAAVWRTVVQDQQTQGERTTPVWRNLAAQVFRGTQLKVEQLTPDQLEFIGDFGSEGSVENFTSNCLEWMEACCRFRTLFKTSSGKIGLGPEVVLPGDIVTILHGNDSPVILRPESDQYHSYVGEAYVHTIMDGEFAVTEPELKLFELV
ncbi:hypothetical protein NUW58_g4303 [Xylaria curta]|uniref:Uncharacterized protein n=1 Tax=Xylaria curta TaxID=42375 RepID=A0ACC1P899_9PEZI|nr:hypothetical protein NUW58_g4303 [Xylaria curta]